MTILFSLEDKKTSKQGLHLSLKSFTEHTAYNYSNGSIPSSLCRSLFGWQIIIMHPWGARSPMSLLAGSFHDQLSFYEFLWVLNVTSSSECFFLGYSEFWTNNTLKYSIWKKQTKCIHTTPHIWYVCIYVCMHNIYVCMQIYNCIYILHMCVYTYICVGFVYV